MADEFEFFDPDGSIKMLATHLLDGMKRADFEARAQELAVGISVDDLSYLRLRFHTPPKEPESYDFRRHGLGGWLSACQFAIFELIFQLEEDAVPFLREIAWGPYDWTQGNAIELLIRLGAKGIQPEETKREISEKFPHIRYEAQLYALEPILPRLSSESELAMFVNTLRSEIPDLDRIARKIEERQG